MDTLYRYYKAGTDPLKSISEMPDEQIISFMKEVLPGHRWFHDDPVKRIETRRNVEKWLYESFVLKGGKPTTCHPCYFCLGESRFLKNFEAFEGQSREIHIPLDIFDNRNISFTFPDSFFSLWLSENADHELFNEDLNGKLFSLDDILKLLSESRIPLGTSMDTPRYKYHLYVEAQVWDRDIILKNKG